MIKVIIVDDEQPALLLLRKLLEQTGMVEVRGEFRNPLEAVEYVLQNPVEAVFLDIEMPELSGMDAAERMMDGKPQLDIVFVTAYDTYAVEAFSLNALDYLVKPLAAERLKESVQRIYRKQTAGSSVHGAGTGREDLHISMFGHFSVRAAGVNVEFRTSKAEELLAYLFTHYGEAVHRSKLLDELWPDFEGDRALMNFNTTLHYVRKALSMFISRPIIEFQRGSYRIIEDSRNTCDFRKLNTALPWGREVEKQTYEEITTALAGYRGGFLEAHDYSWAYGHRVTYEDRYCRITGKAAAYARQHKRQEEALTLLVTALQFSPGNEELNFQLISLFVEKRDFMTAHAYFQAYREYLDTYMDMVPAEKFFNLLKPGT